MAISWEWCQSIICPFESGEETNTYTDEVKEIEARSWLL